MVNPLDSHWSVVKRILKYLCGTAIHGLFLSPTNPLQKFSLRAYIDFDWTSDLEDRGSIFDSCVYFDPNLIF